MQHAIDRTGWQQEADLSGRLDGIEEAVARCVHCGFCLASCPTYRVMGEEMNSPRGRILLGKEYLEGNLELDDLLEHLDPCLGCLACETSCPSGVRYRELLQPLRAHGEQRRQRGWADRARRSALVEVMARPGWFRWALRLGRLVKWWPERLLPSSLRAPLRLVPDSLATGSPKLPVNHPPSHGAPRRARVALLTGCVQQVLDPTLAAATVRVLQDQGVEVVVPPGQGCCGSLALHIGEERRAVDMALRNAEVFGGLDIDAVLTTAAGCSSGLREVPTVCVSADRAPERHALEQLGSKVQDAADFLAEIGLRKTPAALERPVRAVFQDPCHLVHAQKVSDGPRSLLEQIEGLELVSPPHAEVCCGSAGLYSLEQPVVAQELGLRKVRDLLSTDADLVVSGNIGCRTQIELCMGLNGTPLPVLHPLQLLDRAERRVPLVRC